MFYDFSTTTYGKWILAGEHAVLRGHGALVFPILEKKLSLNYQNSKLPLSADYCGESGRDIHLLFWSVLEEGARLLECSLNDLSGTFTLESNIPIGVGMGASAALCVAVARWFSTFMALPSEQIHEFAKQLEHLFHGQSSGLDIEGTAAKAGIYFRDGKASPIQQVWEPNWRLSSCGQIGITSHCIQQVKTLWQQNPLLAAQIDQQMAASVLQAQDALAQKTAEATQQLADAINSAAHCFQAWGLISDSLRHHMEQLTQEGALAVKPTGSGGGGYVVSLWEHPLHSTN